MLKIFVQYSAGKRLTAIACNELHARELLQSHPKYQATLTVVQHNCGLCNNNEH